MGASTSWIAVRGKPRTIILETLGLRIGDSPDDTHESGLIGHDFPSGWYVIAARDYGHPLTEDPVLKQLSVGCEVIAGGVETHVMCSTACGWKDGREIWWVDHDSEVGVLHLSTRGQLPAAFTNIYEGLLAEQDADGGPDSSVDYIFSVPEELTQALTGYHYNEGLPKESHSLMAAPPKASLWDRLFKR